MAEGTKTAVTVREKTAAAVEIAATAGEGTATAMGTAAIVVGAPNVFREGAIIAVGEKTATVAVRTSRRGSAASFNRREKYI